MHQTDLPGVGGDTLGVVRFCFLYAYSSFNYVVGGCTFDYVLTSILESFLKVFAQETEHPSDHHNREKAH
ncbi:hypothetical protein scyTo_0012459 [Scyliorhinus torazame]|uniref:Uncharacterized protein n=1 Tax=Scyliorhinus torazame TaxID=75743 RepID=A0A401P8Z8_SCYTO|nr:hypothetical protein [Scyliorhinus torazame]